MNSAPTELKIKSIAGSINISRLTALQRRQLLSLIRARMPANRRQDVGPPTSASSYKLLSIPSAPDHARRKRRVAPALLDTA